MSRRLSALLSQAKLADRDLERERIRAQRDSANFATGVGALRSLVPAAGELYNAAGKQAEADADTDVAAIMGENLTSTGDATMSAEDYAAKLTREDKRTAQAEPTDGVGRFFASLDPKARARKAAAVKAQAGLAAQVKGNRDAVAAEKAKAEADKAAAKHQADELALKVDIESAHSNLEGFKREDAAAKAEADRGSKGTEGEADRENRLEVARIAAASRRGSGGSPAPTQKDLDDAELRALRIAREKADAEKAKGDAAKRDAGEPMTPAALDTLTNQRQAIKDVEGLKDKVEGGSIGPGGVIQRNIPDFLKFLKSDDQVRFEQAHSTVLRSIAKSKEQGAITTGEQAMYEKMLMDSATSPSAYKQSLADVTASLKDKQAAYEANLKQSRYLVPEDGQRIRVRRKDSGKTGSIPASKFNPDIHERL